MYETNKVSIRVEYLFSEFQISYELLIQYNMSTNNNNINNQNHQKPFMERKSWKAQQQQQIIAVKMVEVKVQHHHSPSL